MTSVWSPGSWRDRPVVQQPDWPDLGALDRSLKKLAGLPPLVFAGEARSLTTAMGRVADGKAFLLQAGDCAESFDDTGANSIRDKLKVILQMAAVLTYSSGASLSSTTRPVNCCCAPTSQTSDQPIRRSDPRMYAR